MEKSKVLDYIYKISPMARDFVAENYDNVNIIYEIEASDNEGVFLKVVLEDMCIYYASFIDDSPLDILINIKEELASNPFTLPEICFNIYGNNTRIIEFVQVNNFSLDMEGHILKYLGNSSEEISMGDLIIKPYQQNYIDLFVDLFASAYEKLNIENGWDSQFYAKNKVGFNNELIYLNNQQCLKSFWKEDVLIGCYIIDGNFLRDIVVHPRLQNCGYGGMMLKHFLRYMQVDREEKNIYLRITKSNIGAKRFYDRYGFKVIASFAEHTYRKG